MEVKIWQIYIYIYICQFPVSANRVYLRPLKNAQSKLQCKYLRILLAQDPTHRPATFKRQLFTVRWHPTYYRWVFSSSYFLALLTLTDQYTVFKYTDWSIDGQLINDYFYTPFQLDKGFSWKYMIDLKSI